MVVRFRIPCDMIEAVSEAIFEAIFDLLSFKKLDFWGESLATKKHGYSGNFNFIIVKGVSENRRNVEMLNANLV